MLGETEIDITLFTPELVSEAVKLVFFEMTEPVIPFDSFELILECAGEKLHNFSSFLST